MDPKKLKKLLNEAGICFTQWNDWELVQRELSKLRVARDKAEAHYCLFLCGVEACSAEWRSGLDSKEPQTFDHWLRKQSLHDDPARYRAMLIALETKGLEWVQRVGPIAIATVVKNLPSELRDEGFRRLADKRADVGQPVSSKIGPAVVAAVKAAHQDICPPMPRHPKLVKLGAKLQTSRGQVKSLEDELKEARSTIAERDRTIERLMAENSELRERLGAAQTALGARTQKPRKTVGTQQPAMPAE